MKMKKIMILSLSFLLLLGVTTAGFAQEKKVNIKAENIKRVIEIIKQNPALFRDPEKIKLFLRLAQSLQKKK